MGVIHKFTGRDGGWDWEGVSMADFGSARPDVTVRRFIGRQDDSCNLELRYFELGPGACSNWESHNYEHAVLILRGRGSVRLSGEILPIGCGDAVFVPAGEVHEFMAAEDEALGFMCAVLDRELRVTVHGEQTLAKFN
jgi:quercetin dioxygenase-like cupin family protein